MQRFIGIDRINNNNDFLMHELERMASLQEWNGIDNGARLSGFRQGLRQTSLRLRPQLVLPAAPDFAKIDSDLLERFGIAPEAHKTCVERTLSEDEQAAQQFAWRLMALACNLLQAIKIPCFDRGLILDIQTVNRDERRYRLACLFPAVEFQSLDWIAECFRRAHLMLSRFADRATTEAEVALLLDDVHEKFVVGARKRIAGGDSTIPVLKSAFLLDIPFAPIGKGNYLLGWGAKMRLTDRSTSELDAAIGSRLSQDKFTSAHLLRMAGLPAPVHLLVWTEEAAVDAANHIGFPVVIKPADKDRGEGVTTGICDAAGVAAAYDSAARLSQNILVERQVPGICHRILVSGGMSPYTVGRLPMAVEGDDVHTVRELVAMANQKEARKAGHWRQKPFPADELAEHTLKAAGLTFDAIPDQGTLAFLRPIETTEWGGVPLVLSDEIHPENLKVAIQATRLLGLHAAGVDMISEDIRKPWYENGAVINEVNFAPYLSLRLDYQCAGAEQFVRRLFPDGARIPVEVFIGDAAAWTAAEARCHALASSGVRAYLCSHRQAAASDGAIRLALGDGGLYARSRALLMQRDADALLLVVQTDELLSQGLPVDSVDAVTLVNRNVQTMPGPARPAMDNCADRLVAMFESYRRTPAAHAAS